MERLRWTRVLLVMIAISWLQVVSTAARRVVTYSRAAIHKFKTTTVCVVKDCRCKLEKR